MSTNFERIVAGGGPANPRSWPLHSVAQTRSLEANHSLAPGAPTLMQQAGLALAQLSLALFPHARRIWIACGPGNNGGDGLVAARHLHQWGKQVVVSLAHDPAKSPPDARQAWKAAQAAGVLMQDRPPAECDACVDALFGIGAARPLQGAYADWALRMNTAHAPTLAVDCPSGLQADTGSTTPGHVLAQHTLSLLTLKPGLFTAQGRDACGDIWFHALGVGHTPEPAAWLLGAPAPVARAHASHKGSYGDVCIVGGAAGMRGAALLAARSALFGGAGRVFICPLDGAQEDLDGQQPELMFRTWDTLDWLAMVVVAGCGGAQAIANHLPALLERAPALVLDADALNRIAESPALQAQLAKRQVGSSVMTPHPLEAARLLQCSVAAVQADRLQAAHELATRYACVVVLKGSGSIVTAPNTAPRINPSGNALLATAGSGDVLAGLLGAYLAQGMDALQAASAAVYRHGLAANRWTGAVLCTSELSVSLGKG